MPPSPILHSSSYPLSPIPSNDTAPPSKYMSSPSNYSLLPADYMPSPLSNYMSLPLDGGANSAALDLNAKDDPSDPQIPDVLSITVRGTPKFQYSDSVTHATLCDHPPKKLH